MLFKYTMINRFKYCRNVSLIISWYVVKTFVSSNDIIVYLYSLHRVQKIVFYFFFVFILI